MREREAWYTRMFEERCWVSGEWRTPATSQRPIRAGNDVEATRRPCSRTFPLLSALLGSPRPSSALLSRCRGVFSSFFAVAKVKLLVLLMLMPVLSPLLLAPPGPCSALSWLPLILRHPSTPPSVSLLLSRWLRCKKDADVLNNIFVDSPGEE